MELLNSYLTFRIGEEYFAANASFVHNIIELPRITEIPDMPDFMMGVINLRGKVLPVIDSRKKFGISETKITSSTCIIVMEVTIDKKQVFMGILVDAVAEVIEMGTDDIKEPPSIGDNVKNAFIDGVFHRDDKFTMVLDMNKVLSNTEIVKINSIPNESKIV